MLWVVKLVTKRLQLYPNPANDEITLQVSAEDNEETKYVIYDSFGKLVMEKNISISSGTSLLRVDVSALTSGVYMMRIFKGDSSEGRMFWKN